MNEITELLRDAAPTPSELDLDRVHREGRRRRQRPRRIAGAAVVALALIAGAAVLVTRDDGSGRSVSVPPATQPEGPTTVAPTTTITPATTEPPSTTLAPGQDRLTTDSRLGYAGLGPITWAMTVAEAERAAGTPFEVNPGPCDDFGQFPALKDGTGAGVSLLFDPDRRIIYISVTNPLVKTISGIHVCSTDTDVRAIYPGAVAGTNIYGTPKLTISNPDGRTIIFWLRDGVVAAMTAGPTQEAAAALEKCD